MGFEMVQANALCNQNKQQKGKSNIQLGQLKNLINPNGLTSINVNQQSEDPLPVFEG